jgi:hypothetical protein
MLTEDCIHEFRIMINELKEEFEEKYSKKNPDFYDGAKSFAKKIKEQLNDIKSNEEEKERKPKNTFTDSDHEVKKFINNTTTGFKDMFRKGKV